MKLLSFASVSLVLLAALGLAAADEPHVRSFNQQVEDAVVFYQQAEIAKSIVNDNDSGSDDDDTSDSMSNNNNNNSSGNGDNCMTVNGVMKCCSGGTLSYNNGKFKCSGEMSSVKGVKNPMWMGMLLMIGILVQLY